MAEIRKINNLDEFNEFIKESENGKTSVLKIGSNWCGPCRTLEQTLKSFNDEEIAGVLLGEVNADEEWFEDIADELKIRGIPVLIAFKDGEEKERVVGAVQRLAIMDLFGRNK